MKSSPPSALCQQTLKFVFLKILLPLIIYCPLFQSYHVSNCTYDNHAWLGLPGCYTAFCTPLWCFTLLNRLSFQLLQFITHNKSLHICKYSCILLRPSMPTTSSSLLLQRKNEVLKPLNKRYSTVQPAGKLRGSRTEQDEGRKPYSPFLSSHLKHFRTLNNQREPWVAFPDTLPDRRQNLDLLPVITRLVIPRNSHAGVEFVVPSINVGLDPDLACVLCFKEAVSRGQELLWDTGIKLGLW